MKIKGQTFFPLPDFPLAVIPCNHARNPVNFTFIPHKHDFHELVFIEDGTGIQNINGKDYSVRAGDVFLIYGNSVHYFREVKNLRLQNILFHPDKLTLPLKQLRKIHGYEMIFRTEPKLRNPRNFASHLHLKPPHITELDTLVSELRMTLALRKDFSEAESLSMFIRIILFISRHYKDCPDSNENLSKISRIITYMEQNFTSPFRLKELASEVCTSPRNFLRIFRRVTGKTPIDYLLAIRLHHAEELLLSKQYSIAEIAEKCAFCDSNYFSRMFSKKYGISPRTYRKLYSSRVS